MDYVVGSVAALISGNVTPNRPKLVRRALTPMKHQPSPNVTPKSELVEDRSIFLSPSVQKKKAIVKKSPKRIFENPDLDVTNEEDGSSQNSPKADKVKKHLKDKLESSEMTIKSPKSPKKKQGAREEAFTPSKRVKLNCEEPQSVEKKNNNKDSPKKNQKTVSESNVADNDENKPKPVQKEEPSKKSKKQKKQKKAETKTPLPTTTDNEMDTEVAVEKEGNKTGKKKNKKRKNKGKKSEITEDASNKREKDEDKTDPIDDEIEQNVSETENTDKSVNPNAITNEDTDSEHDSDDEIESEDDKANKEVLEEQAESSEEEEEEQKKQEKKKEMKVENNETDAEVVKRTLFVGNVPFSAKCKKEIKKIFGKYGQIETIRIRTVPVKDARVTPKMAVIKNELHPDRTTVNVYIKFSSEVSVAEALAENNTVLREHHLRVTRSDSTGSEHDPKCSVFIGNIPFGLEDEGLRAKFEKCGEIESVRIVRDKKTNAGKGFGYVNFMSKDGVELALALTEEDLTIKNRILRVKRVTQTPGKQKGQAPNQRFNQRGPNQGKNQMDRNSNDRRPFDRNNHGNFQDRKQFGNNKFQGRNQGGNFQDRNQGGNFQDRNQGGNFQNRNQGGNFQNRNQGGNFQGRNQGGSFRERNQGGNFQGRSQGGFQRGNQEGNSQGSSNYRGKNQQEIHLGQDGAHRRILKRKNQDGDGPPNKVQKEITSQPEKREKKSKKEFVGMTSEKKKKHKFDKGQKKKKALSEILSKK